MFLFLCSIRVPEVYDYAKGKATKLIQQLPLDENKSQFTCICLSVKECTKCPNNERHDTNYCKNVLYVTKLLNDINNLECCNLRLKSIKNYGLKDNALL